MKHKTLLSIISLLAFTSAQAEFTKVADFEAGLDGAIEDSNAATAAEGRGSISQVDDPFAAGNKVLQLDPGSFLNGTGGQWTWFSIPLPPVTGSGTLYYRFSKETDLVSPVFGTTPSVETPQSYGDYSQVVGQAIDSIMIAYDDTGYTTTNIVLEAQTWYEFWFTFDQPTNVYSAYIRGGEYTAITPIIENAIFRSKGTTPQTFFYARSTVGSLTSPAAVDDVYFDDLYIDTSGTNLNAPGSPGDVGSGSGDTELTDSGPVVLGNGNVANIATRGAVGTGDSLLTAGFVIEHGQKRVLIRGIGPTLGTFGVSGVLADPKLTLFKDEVILKTNTKWGDAENVSRITATSSAVGAFPLDAGSADAVILLTLDAGSYTVQLSGVGDTTGNALIEVYQAK
jgi:hypothetical protein